MSDRQRKIEDAYRQSLPTEPYRVTGSSYRPAMAHAYWNQHIRPTLGDLPPDALTDLRDRYIADVAINPAAQQQITDWWYDGQWSDGPASGGAS